jgi:hypothetical protein
MRPLADAYGVLRDNRLTAHIDLLSCVSSDDIHVPSCGTRCEDWVRVSMVNQQNSHEPLESRAEIDPIPTVAGVSFAALDPSAKKPESELASLLLKPCREEK